MTKHIQAHSGSMIHKAGEKVSKLPIASNYKKSVSPSLVYRPMKLAGSSHVGFSAVYSGKGRKDSGEVSSSVLSLVLISDAKFLNAYRPLAGAIARDSKAEVLCCAVSEDDRLVDSLVERLRFGKSKIATLNVVSENSSVLDLVKERLAAVSPRSSPRNGRSGKGSDPQMRVNLQQLCRPAESKPGVMGMIAGFFGLGKNNSNSRSVSGSYEFVFRKITVDENLRLAAASHCKVVAAQILKPF